MKLRTTGNGSKTSIEYFVILPIRLLPSQHHASIFPAQFQVVSDLHLETPLLQPSYTSFKLPTPASNLCLLGDIGLVKDPALFDWLERLLHSTPNLNIFYVLGNHEAYQIRMETALLAMERFEQRMRLEYGHRFHFRNRTRFDLGADISILGCTLWSRAQDDQASAVARTLTDFSAASGIQDWTLGDHLEAHQKDLRWLNETVDDIERREPHRRIVILTHHSPTLDPRATAPQHAASPVDSGFATDLSGESCWRSPSVEMWAFGHTHYNCDYLDETT